MHDAFKGWQWTMVGILGLVLLGGIAGNAQELKHYDSNSKDYWNHPPSDWFLGDETSDQRASFQMPGSRQ